MEFKPQVDPGQYQTRRYLSKERWMNYWYQALTLLTREPKTVLEIGIGNGVVCELLRRLGCDVKTLDIDARLHPDVVASVTEIPLPDASVDAVLCAEVLEHVPFADAERAMREIARVCRSTALVTLPHAGYVFALQGKIPWVRWSWFWKLPHFWKVHVFNGEHYWELGKKGWSIKQALAALRTAGFRDIKVSRHPDDPGHVFFLCQK